MVAVSVHCVHQRLSVEYLAHCKLACYISGSFPLLYLILSLPQLWHLVTAPARSCGVRSQGVVTDRHPILQGKEWEREMTWLIIAAALQLWALLARGPKQGCPFHPSQHLGISTFPLALLFSTSPYTAQALRSTLGFVECWQATKSKAHLKSPLSHSPKQNSLCP